MEPLKARNTQTFSTAPMGQCPVTVSIGRHNVSQKKLTSGTKKADQDRCLLIGFDTEYQVTGPLERDEIEAGKGHNEVLSYQYNVKLLDNSVNAGEWQEVSGLVIPEEMTLGVEDDTRSVEKRLTFQDFIAFSVGAFIADHPTVELPTDIYLVGHFTRADLPAFQEFENISRAFLSNVRSTFVSIDAFVPIELIDANAETIARMKVHIRDTMLLAPANAKSLADLGEIVGFEKIKLAETAAEERQIKTHMRRFRDDHWEAFKEYAIRDAQVCVRYAERVIGQFADLFGDFKMPLTLTQFGTRLVLEGWDDLGHKADDLLGREEVVVKVYNEKLGYYLKKTTHPFIEEIFFDIPFVTETYHGGRNEQFEFGISPEGNWRDHDLSSAYTTAMSLIGKPRWKQARGMTSVDGIDPLNLAFCSVDFEFPPDVRFPTLPVRTSNGIIFPLAGRSFCAAPEISLAKKLGAKLQFRRGVIVPMDRDQPIFKNFITSCIANRSEHEKNSFGNLFWKEVGNSTYGKTAQGLRKKRVFDLRDDKMVELPESSLTQPFYASFITSFTRAVLGEVLNGFPRDVRVFSVTTDGFLSNATDAQIGQACKGPLFSAFSKGRLALDNSAQPLEIKHEIRQPLGWRTRGSATLKAGDDPKNGIVLQKGGIKIVEPMDAAEQNAYIIRKFLDRGPDDKLEYSVGINLKDMIHKGADFVSKAVAKRLSMEFDWKRLPIDASDASVDLFEETRTHLSFSTAPHPDVHSFQRMRDAWEKFDSKPRRNLKTMIDLQRFLNFVDTRQHPGQEALRYLAREDGDIKRLRRDLCRAFTHSAAGFDLVRSRSKFQYKGFAAILTACSIPCSQNDVDNGKRNPFTPHQTIPTERVLAALNTLKTEHFPELEITQFISQVQEIDGLIEVKKAA